MIERRYREYGFQGVLWVARTLGGPDVAVIARGRINTYNVFALVNGNVFALVNSSELHHRKEFYDYSAACAFAETLLTTKEPY